MSRRTPEVTQADIARAIRAMKAAGYDVRVRITRDGAVVEPVTLEAPTESPRPQREKVIII